MFLCKLLGLGECLMSFLQAKCMFFPPCVGCCVSSLCYHFGSLYVFLFLFRIFCDVAGHLMEGKLPLDLLIGTDPLIVQVFLLKVIPVCISWQVCVRLGHCFRKDAVQTSRASRQRQWRRFPSQRTYLWVVHVTIHCQCLFSLFKRKLLNNKFVVHCFCGKHLPHPQMLLQECMMVTLHVVVHRWKRCSQATLDPCFVNSHVSICHP